jgi:ribose transport system ATP-binding protein
VTIVDRSPLADHPLKAAAAVLQLTGVSKRFGPVEAVRDVAFTARAGEVHALLGENGAGKSTLMGIASGDVHPDTGTIEIGGVPVVGQLSSAQAQRLGLAIVHQHPAVLPDLTVAENLILAVPPRVRGNDGRAKDWVAEQLRRVGCSEHPATRMIDVGIAQRQLIELAKALAIEPKLLILDEPTAPLTADLVELLFEKVRGAAARGAAVVYISHRLQEVRRVAQYATVMRDGVVKGAGPISDMSDDEMVRLIVGRTVTSVYPKKSRSISHGGEVLMVKGLSGERFHDITMTAHGGEIVGIAGITGNGQSEFLRALAGLVEANGEAMLCGKPLRHGRPDAASQAGVTFMSADRHKEGLFIHMSVRENAALSALSRFAHFGIVQSRIERARVEEQRSRLAIRTPSIETAVSALSGGNQQKVILSRALLARANLVLAEEPTAGVDVGARSEIYRILREVASSGTPIVIVSSDIVELEGLCDRVVVFSRGQVVGELSGAEVTEEKIGRTMVTATAHRLTKASEAASRATVQRKRFRKFLAGDYVPSLVLATLILLLGAYVSSVNGRFISAFNIEKLLLLTTALSFVAFGQMCCILTGAIDLSVGPLVGLAVVISSFFFVSDSNIGLMMLGLVAMAAAGAAVGIANGLLVRFGNFTSVAATLGTYIIIQGCSVLLRPQPGGNIDTDVIDILQARLGGIPVAFIIAVVFCICLELALRYTRWGLSIRAIGSNEESSWRVGVPVDWAAIGAFFACSMLTIAGGIMVMAQLGIGDPNQGIEYTLASVAAVVLGGASLFGGRGSFIGVLLGAMLIQEINSATTFLGLSQAWQYWFIGGLTLGAVAVYSQARSAHEEA